MSSHRPRSKTDPADVDEDDGNRVAQEKNKQAWNSLRRFGQPLAIISCVGASVVKFHEVSLCNNYNPLFEAMVAVPLAGLAIASVMNIDIDEPDEMAKNYAYLFIKGLWVSAGIFLANPSAVFFQKLNEGWFKDVFTGSMLNETPVTLGFGLRMMVFFHTINLFSNGRLVKFIYGRSN